jgi:hypothetical protein
VTSSQNRELGGGGGGELRKKVHGKINNTKTTNHNQSFIELMLKREREKKHHLSVTHSLRALHKRVENFSMNELLLFGIRLESH